VDGAEPRPLLASEHGGGSGLTCSVPIRDLRVTWDPERSKALFDKIIADDTESVGKNLCTPSGFPL